MNQRDIVKMVLGERYLSAPFHASAVAFAPSNIALCKYWGKRNTELNLPVTSSLSMSLGLRGAEIRIDTHDAPEDMILLNDKYLVLHSSFARRLMTFLDLFRDKLHFRIDIQSNIPIAAGLASSASGFASVILALNTLFAWELSPRELSILARLGSGSACRSIQPGFVEWNKGVREDGMDSYGECIGQEWHDLCIGLMIVNDKEKSISSREAMRRTVETSVLYRSWPEQAARDLSLLKKAIMEQDFLLLGETAEANSMAMHATMLSAWPSISYATPETLLAMQKIWALRADGLPVYFTQDAGPNLKLLFLQRDTHVVCEHFPGIDVIEGVPGSA